MAASNQTAAIAMKGVHFAATGLGSIGQLAINLTVGDFMTRSSAEVLVTVAEEAAKRVTQMRTEIGAFQNRLERTGMNLAVSTENIENALSVVADADFAVEASAVTRAQILLEAGTAMLAQANTLGSTALVLLG